MLAERQKRNNLNAEHQPLRPSRWLENPHYDRARHRFTWGMEMQTIGAHNKIELVTDNYTSVVLTRRGCISFDLLTVKLTAAGKALLNQIASALTVQPGERYEDINPRTDKAADYDLLSLIGP